MKQIIVTKKGQGIIPRALANGEVIKFTKVCISDKDYTDVELCNLESIESIKQEVSIDNVHIINNTQVEVVCGLDNENLKNAYYIRTIGIYANDGKGNEILYGVSISENVPKYMPKYEGKTLTGILYRLTINVNNAGNVITDVNNATVANVLEVKLIEKRVSITEENIHVIENKVSKIESGATIVGNADKLDNLESSQFVRSDISNGEIKTNGITVMLNKTNTRYGYDTLRNNGIINKDNTAIGYNASRENLDSYGNVSVGSAALAANLNGSENVAVGRLAGGNIAGTATGATNVVAGTYLGYNTQPSANSVCNEIVIGSNTTGRGSNTAHIGNAAISTISFGPATSTNFTNRSDERLKEDIELADLDICYDNIINKLPIKRFKYIDEYVQETDKYKVGFIAQDFEKVLPKSVHKSKVTLHKLDKKGKRITKVVDGIKFDDVYETEEEMLAIDVSQLLPMTIGAMQKLAEIVELQEKKLNDMRIQIDEIIRVGDDNTIS